jgi:hypothetical protein
MTEREPSTTVRNVRCQTQSQPRQDPRCERQIDTAQLSAYTMNDRQGSHNASTHSPVSLTARVSNRSPAMSLSNASSSSLRATPARIHQAGSRARPTCAPAGWVEGSVGAATVQRMASSALDAAVVCRDDVAPTHRSHAATVARRRAIAFILDGRKAYCTFAGDGLASQSTAAFDEAPVVVAAESWKPWALQGVLFTR